jgi:hypothetical protein
LPGCLEHPFVEIEARHGASGGHPPRCESRDDAGSRGDIEHALSSSQLCKIEEPGCPGADYKRHHPPLVALSGVALQLELRQPWRRITRPVTTVHCDLFPLRPNGPDQNLSLRALRDSYIARGAQKGIAAPPELSDWLGQVDGLIP